MKCTVCGYEIKPGRIYCPMCGNKVESMEAKPAPREAEMTWNTKDFPKPKKTREIEMNWGNGSSLNSNGKGLTDADIEAAVAFKKPVSLMADDGSEGFVSIPKKEERKETAAPHYVGFDKEEKEIPQNETKGFTGYSDIPAERRVSRPAAPVMPKEEKNDTPYWYTQNFTASGVMKTGPAFPLPQTGSAQPPVMPMPPMPPIKEAPSNIDPNAFAALSAAMPDATIQYARFSKPTPAYQSAPSVYTPPMQNMDYTMQAMQEKKPEKFYTFQKKNDEFQALLEQEYAKLRANSGKDFDPVPSDDMSNAFKTSSSVKAQDVESFERTLYGEKKASPAVMSSPVPAYPQGGPDVRVIKQAKTTEERTLREVKRNGEELEHKKEKELPRFKEESKEFTGLNLDELIATPIGSEIATDPKDPRFDIREIEKTIQKLTAELDQNDILREESKARLKAMEDARNAYFASLDEMLEETSSKKGPKADATPIFMALKKTEASKEVPAPKEEPKPVRVVEDKKVEVSVEKEPTLVEFPSDELLDEFEGLYDADNTSSDEESGSNHIILKFLLVLIVVVAVCEGLIIAMQYFLPDMPATIKATELESAAIKSISTLIDKATAFINKLLK